MYNGQIGNVGGNDNVKWNRQLAEELDTANWKKEGKIKACIWLDSSAKALLQKYKDKIVADIEQNQQAAENSSVTPNSQKVFTQWQETASMQQKQTKVTPEQKANFMKSMNSIPEAKIYDKKMLKDMGFGKQPPMNSTILPGGLKVSPYVKDKDELYSILDMNGGRTYKNDKGERIRISEFEGQLSGGKLQIERSFNDGKIKDTTIFDSDNKPMLGFMYVKNDDGTETQYSYKFDSKGNKVLESALTYQAYAIDNVYEDQNNNKINVSTAKKSYRQNDEPTKAQIQTENFKNEIMQNLKFKKEKQARVSFYLDQLIKVAQELNGVIKNNFTPNGTTKQNEIYNRRIKEKIGQMRDYTQFIGSGLSLEQDNATKLYKLRIGDKLFNIPERKVLIGTEETENGIELSPVIVD